MKESVWDYIFGGESIWEMLVGLSIIIFPLGVILGLIDYVFDTDLFFSDEYLLGGCFAFVIIFLIGVPQMLIKGKKEQKELSKKEQDNKEKAKNTKSKLSVLSFFGKTNQYQIYDDLVFEITNWGTKTTKYVKLFCTNYNCVDDKINDFVYTCQGFIGNGATGRFEFSVNNHLVSYYMLNKVSVVYSDGSVEDFDGKDVHFGRL